MGRYLIAKPIENMDDLFCRDTNTDNIVHIFDGFRPSLSNNAPFGAFQPLIRIFHCFIYCETWNLESEIWNGEGVK